MSLERFYKKDVMTVSPEATLVEIAERMRDHHVGSVVVVENDRPVGIVTDRDIVVKAVAQRKDPDRVPARNLMASGPALVNVNYDLVDAARIMRDRAVRRLPVVDEKRRLLGILSLDDLLGLLGDQIHNLADAVRTELAEEGNRKTTGRKKARRTPA
jgi:CBS domain-containing protein